MAKDLELIEQKTSSNALRVAAAGFGTVLVVFGGPFLMDLGEIVNDSTVEYAGAIVSVLGAGAVVAAVMGRD